MEKNGDLREALKAIKNVAESDSWFRGSPHRWASASLRLAYAVACVEVVSKSSEKARILYNRIIEAWSEAGIKAIFEEITSIKPDVLEADSCVLTIERTSGCLPFYAYVLA